MFLDKIFRILDFLNPWTPIPRIWYCNNPSSHPSLVIQSCVESSGLQHCYSGGVFVVPSAFKSFLFELHMEMSYYLNVFVQHGRVVIHIPLMGCSGFLNFWQTNLKTFQGLSRTYLPFFKDSVQWKREPWIYVFFSSSATWPILSWRSFCVCSFSFGSDKVSTEIQGLSTTDCYFQGLSRPWIPI